MKRIIIESPKARVAFTDVEAALAKLRAWLERELKAEKCASVTVGVHDDGDGCDHE